jgi:hypothetical protein
MVHENCDVKFWQFSEKRVSGNWQLVELLQLRPKSMLGTWISFSLDPDLFGQIQILDRAMAVRSQLDSELMQNSPDLKFRFNPMLSV